MNQVLKLSVYTLSSSMESYYIVNMGSYVIAKLGVPVYHRGQTVDVTEHVRGHDASVLSFNFELHLLGKPGLGEYYPVFLNSILLYIGRAGVFLDFLGRALVNMIKSD